MESHEETGCKAPEGPILCINNCGFFGSAATMNMCSKCHKDLILKEQQAQFAASSIESIVNANSTANEKDLFSPEAVELKSELIEADVGASEGSSFLPQKYEDLTPKEGPNRCNVCRKRVGLTGFSCKCGNLFCAVHRYSDKHDCPFDYRTAGRDAIAKANPVIKADKIDKI